MQLKHFDDLAALAVARLPDILRLQPLDLLGLIIPGKRKAVVYAQILLTPVFILT